MTRQGYGFVVTSEGDYYVSGRDVGTAMHGDHVVVRPDARKTGKGKSGAIIRVLERAHSVLVGTYERNGPLGIVVPIDRRIMHDIFVSSRDFPAARTGDVVTVRIEQYPSRHQPAQGYIEEIVGRADDPNIGVEVIIREHGLSTVFPEDAIEESEALKLDVAEALRLPDDGLVRRDLRDRYIFTIDPEDSKDFDDAISFDWIDGRPRLGVHIADVSAYVRWNTALDEEARQRATSVYLVDRVIPMLPEKISNGLCSLSPYEDRLAFTVDMYLSKDAGVEEYEIYPSVIRSNERFIYGDIDLMLVEQKDYPSDTAKRALVDFALFARRLEARKQARGGLDFETVEAKVRLTEEGVPTQVVLRKRTPATSMIEEAMILANETVAAHMLAHEAPMVYRIHERPDADALESLTPILTEFNYPVKDLRESTPQSFQRILAYSRTRPERYLINSLVLRAMKQARYVSYHETHFGLASEAYTHFTSPIRRYPDLLVHRLLKAQLAGDLDDPRVQDMIANLEWMSEHSSSAEREADSAAYDSTMLKLCEYMQNFIGEEFDGFITGIVGYGMFVRLENTAEGLVHVNTFGADTSFDPVKHTLSVDTTGEYYRLGERVRVRIENVSVGERKIDMRIV